MLAIKMSLPAVCSALLLISLIAVQFGRAQRVFADSSSLVNATIKISVCGNEVKEGGEDCDRLDLGNTECQTLGFGGGTLACDISCSLDTSNCTAPTPTPSSTSTPNSVSLQGDTFEPTSMPISTSEPEAGSIRTTRVEEQQSVLPPELHPFDLDGDGRIQLVRLHDSVKVWVDDWRESLPTVSDSSSQNQEVSRRKCDINRDGQCTVKDFSILMYYIER